MKMLLRAHLGISMTLISFILAGLSAGIFYTWSVTVMTGLNATDPKVAIAAMQAINANIRNAGFAVVVFGVPVSILGTSLVLGLAGRRRAAVFAGAAFACAATVLAVTATVNVPLNETLAALSIPAERQAAAAIWQEFSGVWTAWNHVRAAAGVLAFFFIALAMKSVAGQGH